MITEVLSGEGKSADFAYLGGGPHGDLEILHETNPALWGSHKEAQNTQNTLCDPCASLWLVLAAKSLSRYTPVPWTSNPCVRHRSSQLSSTTFAQAPAAGACRTTPALSDPAAGAHWNGWGASGANTRFQPADQARLNAVDVPKLKLKWAFGIPNVMQARSQPAVAGGRLFMASDSGSMRSIRNGPHILDI